MTPTSDGNYVLIVDDDRQVLGLVNQWLTRAGFVVIACDSFEAAKRQLAARTPDVLIADVRLGAFNGLQLAILAKERAPHTAAFVMSAFDDASLRSEARLCGADFLPKPFTREQVVGAVQMAVNARQNTVDTPPVAVSSTRLTT
jgi:DNA-binding NtrC family response regulator